jgi:hypothetical protein
MEISKANNWYPIFVWLLTVAVIGPIILSIMIKYFEPANYFFSTEIGTNFRICSVFGIIFSLPVLIIYFIIFKVLTNKNKSSLFIKIYLTLLCLIGMYFTFYIMGEFKILLYTLPYPIGLIIATLIFRVYKEKKKIIIKG